MIAFWLFVFARMKLMGVLKKILFRGVISVEFGDVWTKRVTVGCANFGN